MSPHRDPETTGPWAVCLPPRRAGASALLRLGHGVSVLTTADAVWLRGDRADAGTDRLVRRLPGKRYSIGQDGRLRPPEATVPTARLPAGVWRPIETWLVPEPQPAAFGGAAPERVRIGLVRSERGGRDPDAILVRLDAFLEWVETAPSVRVRRLAFAASASRALVLGRPLPPLPGQRLVVAGAVAWPSGFEPTPISDPTVLAAALGVAAPGLALLDRDGGVETIPVEAFVPATRSALRATAANALRSRPR